MEKKVDSEMLAYLPAFLLGRAFMIISGAPLPLPLPRACTLASVVVALPVLLLVSASVCTHMSLQNVDIRSACSKSKQAAEP